MKKTALINIGFALAKSLNAQEGSVSDSSGNNMMKGHSATAGSPWIWVIVAALIIVFLVVLSDKPSKRTKN